MIKKIVSLTLAVLMSVTFITACSSMSDEPCMYCGQSPSKGYKKSDGTTAYVCKDCSETCMICGDEKATKHYESLLGIVFVCNDCYKMATSYN